MAKKQQGWYIKGLPIHPKWKFLIMGILFISLLLNMLLPIYFESLDYTFNGGVSLILLALFVIVSIGSKITEGIVIGLSSFSIMSNLWDMFVRDLSAFRKQVFVASVVILLVSLIFGKISITNLVSIIRGQLGVKKTFK